MQARLFKVRTPCCCKRDRTPRLAAVVTCPMIEACRPTKDWTRKALAPKSPRTVTSVINTACRQVHPMTCTAMAAIMRSCQPSAVKFFKAIILQYPRKDRYVNFHKTIWRSKEALVPVKERSKAGRHRPSAHTMLVPISSPRRRRMTWFWELTRPNTSTLRIQAKEMWATMALHCLITLQLIKI